MEQEYASTLLENAVSELSRLPGIGRKTALRLALHILRQEERMGVSLGEAIIKLRQGVKYCKTCHNISETDKCPICANPARDASMVCVVESVKDVMSFENTRQYIGAYAAVLNGFDVLVFTGGVGENQTNFRDCLCKSLAYLGIDIDPEINANSKGEEIEISTKNSKIKVVVIPTDEELMIASDTKNLVK